MLKATTIVGSAIFFIFFGAAPPIASEPESGAYIPKRSLIIVDFPEPDSPRIKIFSFCLNVKSVLFKTFFSLYENDKPTASMLNPFKFPISPV